MIDVGKIIKVINEDKLKVDAISSDSYWISTDLIKTWRSEYISFRLRKQTYLLFFSMWVLTISSGEVIPTSVNEIATLLNACDNYIARKKKKELDSERARTIQGLDKL